MRRKLLRALVALGLTAALCGSALAAPAWQVADGVATASGLGAGELAVAACYDADGRLCGIKALSSEGAGVPLPNAAASLRCFWLGGDLAPRGGVVSASLTPDRVEKRDGQVILTGDSADGVTVTRTVTEKVTGKVSGCASAGTLWVNGVLYPATELTVQGCAVDVSAEAFGNWLLTHDSGCTYDFYLDSSGAICWMEEVAGPEDPCLLLSVGVQGDAVEAELLFTDSRRNKTVTVSALDGAPVADANAANDAAARLSANAPGGRYLAQRQPGGSYALAAATDGDEARWNAVFTLPACAVVGAADFSGGRIGLVADGDTHFTVVETVDGVETTRTGYDGFQALPALDILRGYAIVRESDPAVADHVWLNADGAVPKPDQPQPDDPQPETELPAGLVMVCSNDWSISPDLEDVYTVDIVDAEGAPSKLLVGQTLMETIRQDSMEADRFSQNTYVGRLCRITAIDQNDVVQGLEPVEAAQVQALDSDGVVTAAGSWGYDPQAHFVFVALGCDVSDSGGLVTVSDYGTFSPRGFFDPNDVGEGAVYASVRAAVLPSPENAALARYVYVIREFN